MKTVLCPAFSSFCLILLVARGPVRRLRIQGQEPLLALQRRRGYEWLNSRRQKRKFRVNVGGRSAEAMARLLHSGRNGRGDLARPVVCCHFSRCGLLDRSSSIRDPHVL